MRTQNKLHQSTRHIDDRSKEVLRRREHGLDAVEEGLDDGAEDVEDGLEEGGDGVCNGGHGCGSVLIVALLGESYVWSVAGKSIWCLFGFSWSCCGRVEV